VADPEVVATLTLALVPGVGSQRLRLLVGAFGSAEAALRAPQARLAAVHGISQAAAAAIRAASTADGERVLAQLADLGNARALLPADPDYPVQLVDIRDPPAVLYAWGDVSLLARPAVAIVGSRNHTS
jgi:DNA processing protein